MVIDAGAADKTAIQRVKVQPYSRCGGTRIGYLVMAHFGAGNKPGYVWCKHPGGSGECFAGICSLGTIPAIGGMEA